MTRLRAYLVVLTPPFQFHEANFLNFCELFLFRFFYFIFLFNLSRTCGYIHITEKGQY